MLSYWKINNYAKIIFHDRWIIKKQLRPYLLWIVTLQNVQNNPFSERQVVCNVFSFHIELLSPNPFEHINAITLWIWTNLIDKEYMLVLPGNLVFCVHRLVRVDLHADCLTVIRSSRCLLSHESSSKQQISPRRSEPSSRKIEFRRYWSAFQRWSVSFRILGF